MPDTTTPAQRVAEFLRQWTLPAYKTGRGDEIYGINFDPAMDETVSLTVSDLEDILAELDELRSTLDRYEEIHEANPVEAGVLVSGHGSAHYADAPLTLRGGLKFTFRLSPDTTDQISVSALENGTGIEIYALPGRAMQKGAGLFVKAVTGNVVNVVLR